MFNLSGYSLYPAQEDTKSAMEAKKASGDYASRVEAENKRRERELAVMLGKTNANELSAQSGPPKGRSQSSMKRTTPENLSLVDITVWACSRDRSEIDSTAAAEMQGRQLLLFAKGAFVKVIDDGLKIQSSGVLPGVQVTRIKDAYLYTVLQLDASIGIQKHEGMRLIESKSYLIPLKSIVQSISENAERVFRNNLGENPDATKGLIILRKMELRDPSIKYGPRCRYWMDIYATDKL